MANALKHFAEEPVRMMITGDPGSGKTGALASLVDAGFKLRIIDYDGNLDPLWKFVKDKAKLANVDSVHLEDKMRIGGGFIEPVGIPTAFKAGFSLMDKWEYTDKDGEVVNLGSSADWGPDVIVVLDGLTGQGDAAMNRAMKMLNKNPATVTQQVWKMAMSEQGSFIKRLTSKANKHHTIVICHRKIIAPKGADKTDDNTVQELKNRLVDMIPTKFFPRALGYELPQVIGGEFPTLIQVESEVKAGKVRRIIRTIPQENLDLKVPAPNVPDKLDISDGLLQIFNALSPASVAAVSGANPVLRERTANNG